MFQIEKMEKMQKEPVTGIKEYAVLAPQLTIILTLICVKRYSSQRSQKEDFHSTVVHCIVSANLNMVI